jgi:uncharacterized protein (DUF427 family)
MAFHEITTEPVAGRVRVEIDGEVVAQSDDAVALHEGSLPTRYYLPAADVRAELLRPSEHRSHCPFKGDASYHSVVTPGGGEHRDVVWFYPEPNEAVAAIRDHLAFYNDRATIFLEGEPVA